MYRRKILEKNIEGHGNKVARGVGVEHLKLGSLYQNDWPDQIYWFYKQPVLIEYKRPGEVPTTAQYDRISYLRSQGYEVHICDSKEEAARIILEADARARDRRREDVGAPPLSGQNGRADGEAGRRRNPSRPRNGEDKLHAEDAPGASESGARKGRTRHRT